MVTSKIIFAFLGSLLLASGIICMTLGCWGYLEYMRIADVNMFPAKYIIIASIILIMVGAMLMLTALSGFLNICFNSKKGWWTFIACLILIFILITTIIVLSIVYRNKIQHSLADVMYSAVKDYGSDSDMQEIVDTVQTVFHCCGVFGASDWLDTSYGKVPHSCSGAVYSKEWEDETTGCYDLLTNMFDQHMKIVVGVAIGVYLIFLLGMFVSCALICFKKVVKKEKEVSVSYEKFY